MNSAVNSTHEIQRRRVFRLISVTRTYTVTLRPLCRNRRRRRRRHREARRRQAMTTKSKDERPLSRSRRAATARTERLWDHGVIPYEIEANFSGACDIKFYHPPSLPDADFCN